MSHSNHSHDIATSSCATSPVEIDLTPYLPPASSSVLQQKEVSPVATACTRFCVYCKQDKPWIFRGDKVKDGSKIYIDDKGRRWAGKRCPDCERKRVRAANRHDHFERSSIVSTLEAQGYTVTNTTSPMIIEKHGQKHTVAIQRAFTDSQGRIIVEDLPEASQSASLTALLFQTTKLIPSDQLQNMGDKLCSLKDLNS